MATTKITWLHLTDLHMGVRGLNDLWPNVEHTLLADLKHVIEHCAKAPIDVVFFTGDLVQTGASREFDQVGELLERLWNKFQQMRIGVEPKLLMVPGNHDLVRPQPSSALLNLVELWDHQWVQKTFWDDSDSDNRRVVSTAFANYVNWSKKTKPGPEIVTPGILPGDFSATLEKDGVRLGILGLNSAFLQLADESFISAGSSGPKLAVDVHQFNGACYGSGPDWCSKHHVTLLLTHHPPAWLTESARRDFYGEIHTAGRFALHLCGHLHESCLTTFARGGSEPRRELQGCSVFGMEGWGPQGEHERLHGFTLGQFEFATEKAGIRKVRVRLWPRRASRMRDGSWTITADPEYVYKKGKEWVGWSWSVQPDYQPSPPLPRPPKVYLHWVRARTNQIDIRGIAESHEVLSFPMLELYVALYGALDGPQGEELTPLTELVQRIPRMLLEGDPGSGKTTFLRYLARVYVDQSDKPLPLLLSAVSLHRYLSSLAPVQGEPEWQVFLNYWLERSRQEDWDFNGPDLRDQLENGEALVLLDDFDQLRHAQERVLITRVIDGAVQKWPGCRWVIACRPRVAVGNALPLDFTRVRVTGLRDPEINQFVRTWVNFLVKSLHIDHLGDRRTEQFAHDLMRALHMRSDIIFLARNPLMLTAMAVVHWNQRRIPEGRAELYEAVVKWLLRPRPARELIEYAEAIRRECYQVLALAMFSTPLGRQTEVDVEWAAQRIAPILKESHHRNGSEGREELDIAVRFIEQEEVRTGLVIRRGEGRIAFWHLSFQEYLAACEITSRTDDPQTGWWPLIRGHLHEPEWREVLRYIPVRFLRLGRARVLRFLAHILETRKPGSLKETARVVGLLSDVLYYLSAYDFVLRDDEINEVEGYADARDRVMEVFTEEGLALGLRERYDAAIALGTGGDPRFLDQEKNWVRIPGGRAWVGAQNTHPRDSHYDELAEPNQQSVHEVFSKPFEIGRYMVTVQEYSRFVETGGYRNRLMWSDRGWQLHEQENILSPDNWEQQRAIPNRPVFNVNWYEAQAYCRWLSEADGHMDYRLPTEAEWEYVARRGQSRDYYQRFCCGNCSQNDVRDKFNSGRADLRMAAPVGLFPRDASPDGVMDMNGNGLEWTQSPVESLAAEGPTAACCTAMSSDQTHYYLRSGSWRHVPQITASRMCRESAYRAAYVGFRVVRLPKPIRLKGRAPSQLYPVNLADLYAKHQDNAYDRSVADEILKTCTDVLPGVSTALATDLFPATASLGRREQDRLPVPMGQAPPEKLEFNLHYQDSRLKLAVEDKLGSIRDRGPYVRDVSALLEAVAVLLRMSRTEENLLWQELTDNDLDALVFMVLDRYDSTRRTRLLRQGFATNELALEGFKNWPRQAWPTLEDLVHYQVFAGTVWWLERKAERLDLFAEGRKLEINDMEPFQHDVLSRPRRLLFFFSDNGELVWDLALIQYLLKVNPRLEVTGVINTEVVENDANQDTLQRCLEDPVFGDLASSSRFKMQPETIRRSSVDLSFCSEALRAQLKCHDLAFVKGAAAFETMKMLPIDAYFAFVVGNSDSQIYTGLKRGCGVFARVPAGMEGYKYRRETLAQIHPRFA